MEHCDRTLAHRAAPWSNISHNLLKASMMVTRSPVDMDGRFVEWPLSFVTFVLSLKACPLLAL